MWRLRRWGARHFFYNKYCAFDFVSSIYLDSELVRTATAVSTERTGTGRTGTRRTGTQVHVSKDVGAVEYEADDGLDDEDKEKDGGAGAGSAAGDGDGKDKEESLIETKE